MGMEKDGSSSKLQQKGANVCKWGHKGAHGSKWEDTVADGDTWEHVVAHGIKTEPQLWAVEWVVGCSTAIDVASSDKSALAIPGMGGGCRRGVVAVRFLFSRKRSTAIYAYQAG